MDINQYFPHMKIFEKLAFFAYLAPPMRHPDFHNTVAKLHTGNGKDWPCTFQGVKNVKLLKHNSQQRIKIKSRSEKFG